MNNDDITCVDSSSPWMIDESFAPQAFVNLKKADNFLENLYSENPDMRIYQKENYWPSADSYMTNFRPYVVTADGLLIIPVKGSLTYKLDVSIYDWVTGYPYIRAAIERGLEDKSVNGIILDVDSGGGTTPGMFELSDYIYSVRDEKPIIAIVDAFCASAAYGVASAASGLYLSPGSLTGSIGVIIRRLDISEHLKEEGIKVTYLYAGPRKGDGNIENKLSDGEETAKMTIINDFYDIFCLHVARNRNISKESVIDTKSGIFTAARCFKLGLADEHDFDAIIPDFIKICAKKKE